MLLHTDYVDRAGINEFEQIRENLGRSVLAAQLTGETLKGNVVKATELYLKSTGQFAPEEHILKNGGTVPGAFVPKGVEGMSEADLKKIAGIGKGEVIDAEATVVNDGRRGGEGVVFNSDTGRMKDEN